MTRSARPGSLLAALVLATLPLGAETVPFALPLPDGWRAETIPFPLDFAPELDVDGLEELRFAPGMFEEGANDFWTYSFLWWIPSDRELALEDLEADLVAYYRGLAEAVAASRGFEIDENEHEARLRASEDATFLAVGTVRTVDAFVTRERVDLRLRVMPVPCPEVGRQAVFFEVSPRSTGDPVWDELAAIRTGFACPPENEAGSGSTDAPAP